MCKSVRTDGIQLKGNLVFEYNPSLNIEVFLIWFWQSILTLGMVIIKQCFCVHILWIFTWVKQELSRTFNKSVFKKCGVANVFGSFLINVLLLIAG